MLHLSRWAAIPLLLLVILTTALLHRWMAVGTGSSAGICVSPEAQRVPHVSRWAAVYICDCCVFLIPLRHQWRLLFYTLRVCVFLPIYSGRQACCGHTSRGHTERRSHRIYHPPSFCTVLALIFIARRIQPFRSLVDREVEFCLLTILLFSICWTFILFYFCEEKFQLPGFELQSHRVRRFRGYLL